MTPADRPVTILDIALEVIVAELTARGLGPITPDPSTGRIGIGAAPGFQLIVTPGLKGDSIKLDWRAGTQAKWGDASIRIGIDNLAAVCRDIADAAWASGLVTAEARRAAVLEFARSRLPEGMTLIRRHKISEAFTEGTSISVAIFHEEGRPAARVRFSGGQFSVESLDHYVDLLKRASALAESIQAFAAGLGRSDDVKETTP